MAGDTEDRVGVREGLIKLGRGLVDWGATGAMLELVMSVDMQCSVLDLAE